MGSPSLHEKIFDDKLNHRERQFCHDYLMNGLDMCRTVRNTGKKDAKPYYRYLENENVQKYLNEKVKKVEAEFDVSFSEKLRMLWFIAEKEVEENARTSITAINEMNKMQGHHAPEQYVHKMKADADIEQGNAVARELLEKHAKEY